MLDFIRFPREVRDMIYGHALVLDERCIRPFLSPPEAAEKGHLVRKVLRVRLAAGLLAVSKLVRDEGRPIFYGGNIWHLSLWKSRDDKTIG